MIVVTVLAVWLVLCAVTAGLFVAVIRGGGGTDAAEVEPVTPRPVALPGQRPVEAPVPTAFVP